MEDDGSYNGITQRMLAEEPVTRRAPQEDGITRRLDPSLPADAKQLLHNITARMRDEAVLMAVLQLKPGIQIADRYRVKAGPLGGVSGEAEIYRCVDERTGNTVAVKLYRHNMAPKEDVLKGLLGLNHPDIVSIKDYGLWTGRFYEAMEYCEGGSMADLMPLNEAQLRAHIPQIVNGLRYCHQQGIIHRDIKPNNLLFRDAVRSESVLGDFGISSILDAANEGVRVTQTAANLTIDYAAPELLDGHSVGPKTDYYSLGVTIIHLLRGDTPFKGLSNTDILVAHLRGRIPYPPQLSVEFEQLLNGLLQVNPENRWGYRHVHAWLNGEAILNEDGSPWRQQNHKPAIGYPGYPEARTPRELGQALHRFDATKQLFRGDIRRWVFDHHDPSLAERIEDIEENYTHNPVLGMQKLRYLLDPAQALQVGRHEAYNLRDLLNLLTSNDTATSKTLTQLLFSGALAIWMDTLDNVNNRGTLVEKVALIGEKLRHKDADLALFALRCTLDPKQPLPLIDTICLPHPSKIEEILHTFPQTETALVERVLDGYFEQWLRAAEFPGWQDDIRFINSCRMIYAGQDKLLGYSIRWHYQPQLPFSFSGTHVTDPKELARLIDHDETSRQHGLKLLSEGWIRAWLVSSGRMANPDLLDQVLWNTQASEESKLEAVLQLMDPSLEKPKLAVRVTRINFGPIHPQSPRSKTIVIRNASRGHLSGELHLAHHDRGFTIDQTIIEGVDTTVRISAHSLGMPEATRQATKLHIASNGGNYTIPLSYRVPRANPNRELPDFFDLFMTFLRVVNPQHLLVVGILLFLVINLTFCHHPVDTL